MAVKPKSNAGRPSLLSKEVQEAFLNNRALGLSLERSARLAGVSYDAVKNWRRIAAVALPKSIAKRSAHEQKCVEFHTAVSKVDDEWLRRCEVVMNLALTPGQDQSRWDRSSIEERRLAAETARWKASHQAPAEYSLRTELTGADGGPLEVDATGLDVFEALLKVQKSDAGE